MIDVGMNEFLAYEDGYKAGYAEAERKAKAKKPQTNGDKIRQMPDEDLALWLDLLVNKAEIYGENKVWLNDTPRYCTEWLEWLKAEASE